MTDTIDLSSNPFVPPANGRCLINELPSELLSHIFTLGWTPERDDEPDGDDFEDVDSDDGTYSSISSDDSASHHSKTPEEEEEEKERRLPFNVLVSHVCERWRAVALENPLLWSHIRFVGNPPYERATTYLARAKEAPLTITIDRTVEDEDDFSMSEDGEFNPEDNDPDLSIIGGIMDVITPHVAHWQALQIMVSFYPHMHRALQALGAAGPAPLLEVLQLYHYEDTDEHLTFKNPELREQPFVLFNGVAPRLAQVALWGVHVPWSKDGAPYLTGLTDLELAYHARDVRPGFYDFARILRASPDLRSLTLCLSCPAGAPTEWPHAGMPEVPPEEGAMQVDLDAAAPLVLPKLTDLVLAYLEPKVLLSLLPRLALPALTSLALDLEEDDYTDVLAYLASPRSLPHQFSSFSSSSGPASLLSGPGVAGGPPREARSLLSNLTSLKIASLPANEAVVRDAYKQLDKLVALNLNVAYLGDTWLDLLFPQPDASGRTDAGELLLPRLESLTTTGVDGLRMRELVEARTARGKPLRTVLMNQDDDVTMEDEEWLGKHVERFEFFEGSDEEEVEMLEEIFEDDEDGDWEDEDEDEDFDEDDNGDDFEDEIVVTF
ncbi:hypothetical protein PYCCODRAFT_1381821 [Trametes coccinea BRFM310]|uniref:Cytochrome c domain-containing protein n=1 Tax=Trametes coccinea (strain BRFM310) TaxID=1353009 RepID=A0A1Y2J4V4_TRAC3|nr:hypothetical protein PYCCODRAFT_1381821 [Trametes coccinea BRFM310]